MTLLHYISLTKFARVALNYLRLWMSFGKRKSKWPGDSAFLVLNLDLKTFQKASISYRILIQIDGPSNMKRVIKQQPSKKLGKSFYQKEELDSSAWEEYQKKESSDKSFQRIDLNTLLISKPRYRYRLLIVLNELVELSQEFYQTQRVGLAYNIIGFEGKIQLFSTYALRYANAIPINRVRLYYFFSDTASSVNELLRQKDKAKIDLFFDNNKESSASSMLDLSDFCSPLVTQKRFYFNCTGAKAMCFIKFSIGMTRSQFPVDVSRLQMKELREGTHIYTPIGTYYSCEPLPGEWVDMMPNIKEYNASFEQSK